MNDLCKKVCFFLVKIEHVYFARQRKKPRVEKKLYLLARRVV